jgi:hypothetical protein
VLSGVAQVKCVSRCDDSVRVARRGLPVVNVCVVQCTAASVGVACCSLPVASVGLPRYNTVSVDVARDNLPIIFSVSSVCVARSSLAHYSFL